jgi:streptogramin lyase
MAKLALLAVACTAAVAGSSPQPVARVSTGDSPAGATSAYGAVWVANDGSGTLARIDPRTNRVTRRARLRPGVFSVTHGFGALWVVNYARNTLTRVNPSTMRTRSVRVGAVPDGVLAAYGRVWVTAWEAGRLVEVDPRSLKIVRRTRIGARPSGLRAAAGAVWVGFGRSATAVARVDPRTRRIERVPVGVRAPAVFSVGTRDLWIKAGDNVLVRLDPFTRNVRARLSFGGTLAHGALASDGTIWLPDKERDVVHRVDPKTSTVVDEFAAGRGAFFPLRAFGSMWVTSYAGKDVWRYESAGR